MAMPRFDGSEALALNTYLDLLDQSFKDKIKLAPVIENREVILALYQDARIECVTDFIELYRA